MDGVVAVHRQQPGALRFRFDIAQRHAPKPSSCMDWTRAPIAEPPHAGGSHQVGHARIAAAASACPGSLRDQADDRV